MFDHPVSNGAKPEPRNVGEVYVDTLVNHGGTFDRKTFLPVTFTDGYTVGIDALGDVHVLDFTPAFLARLWPSEGEYVGTWIDTAHDDELGFDIATVYVDRVVHTPFLGVARAIGNINGEIAIWDCKRGESIVL